jgi:hypothetical protein
VYGLAALSAATVGLLLASRRPRHPVAWLLLALGWWFIYTYAAYALLVRRGASAAVGSAAMDLTVVVMATCIGFILLLTPTGSLPSPSWRWWARIAATAPPLILVSWALPLARGLAFVVAGLAIPAGAWSLVVRFRRDAGVERQQVRWLAVTAAPVALAVAASAALALAGNEVLLDWAPGVCLALLPLGIGAAILRYRLYDLDRIVSRALAYGLLTALLGLGYAALVLGLGRLLPQGSNLVVAVATLVVAAAFQPARRRVQAAVDRRFNRRRYDATQTIEAFSARLRQQIELDSLTRWLLAVVHQTMQPTRASLWLRPSRPASAADRSREPR